MMNTKEEQMYPFKFVSRLNIKDRPTEANPSPIRMIRYSDHEQLMQAAINSLAKSVPEDEAPNPKDYDRTTIDGEANYRLDEHSWKSKKSMLAAAPQPPQAVEVDDSCIASGEGCYYVPDGPEGEMQCKYCGKEQPPQEDRVRELLISIRNCFADAATGRKSTRAQINQARAIINAELEALAAMKEPNTLEGGE